MTYISGPGQHTAVSGSYFEAMYSADHATSRNGPGRL